MELGFQEAVADPTPLDELDLRSLPEQAPHSLRWGTRDAVLQGGQRLASQVQAGLTKPKLPLDGESFQGKALPDLWGKLKPRRCHVVANGKEVVGKAWPAGCDVQGAQIGFASEVPLCW